MQQSMRIEKLRKVRLCFITGCFVKSFNIGSLIIFLYHKLIRSSIFAFRYQNDLRNIKRGSRERQIARNGKLQYLFQSFNNEHNTNKFSLLTKCAYMTLKVNCKRSF